MARFKVTLPGHNSTRTRGSAPTRTYYVRAADFLEAFMLARSIEVAYERPEPARERTFEEAVIEVLTKEEER